MSNCSIVSISKIIPDLDDNVDFSQVYNSVIENPKVDLYLTHIQENEPEKLDLVYELLKLFATEIVDTCYKKVKDICIEIDYEQPMTSLTLDVKLLLTTGEQMMDQEYFNICINLFDKFEERLIDADMHNISFDFNVMLKNEYTRTITVKKTVD